MQRLCPFRTRPMAECLPVVNRPPFRTPAFSSASRFLCYAFTLIELLVAISIIAILVALLLPYSQYLLQTFLY